MVRSWKMKTNVKWGPKKMPKKKKKRETNKQKIIKTVKKLGRVVESLSVPLNLFKFTRTNPNMTETRKRKRQGKKSRRL